MSNLNRLYFHLRQTFAFRLIKAGSGGPTKNSYRLFIRPLDALYYRIFSSPLTITVPDLRSETCFLVFADFDHQRVFQSIFYIPSSYTTF